MNVEQKLVAANLLRDGIVEVNNTIKDMENKTGDGRVVINLLRSTKSDPSDNFLLRERKRLARKVKECYETYKCRLESFTDVLFSGSETEIDEVLGENSGCYKD